MLISGGSGTIFNLLLVWLLHWLFSLTFGSIAASLGDFMVIGDLIAFILLQIALGYALDHKCRDYDSRKDNIFDYRESNGKKNVHLIVLQHGFCSHYSRLFWFARLYHTIYMMKRLIGIGNERKKHPLLEMSNLKRFFGSSTHIDKNGNVELDKICQSWLKCDEMGEMDEMDEMDDVIIHIARCNSNGPTMGFWSTNDGIDKGGKRLANEIKKMIDKNKDINKISLIGGSLGGLYIRYCLRDLYDSNKKEFYGNVKCENFITVASPHLGVDDWVQNRIYRCSNCIDLYKLAKRITCILTPTVKQLLRLDCNFRNNKAGNDNSLLEKSNKCLLWHMANDDCFIEPLKLFKNCVNYACARNDKRVSCYSGAIIPLKFNVDKYWMTLDDMKLSYSFSQLDRNDVVKFKRLIENSESKDDEHGNDGILIDASDSQLFDYDDDPHWFARLESEIEWNRIVVCLNQNYAIRKWCHTFLTCPSGKMKSCQPIFEQYSKDFVW